MGKAKTYKLPLERKSSTFELIIPLEVEAKIRHLCSVVHDVEWSGTLFYRYEGSLDDGTFKVTCVDLCVMDIGTSAYTEYKESADVINYRALNDLLAPDIMEGLIHSHNNMSTFFSGTDCSTLVEEGTNTNHFVSLIVNNAGTYTAAVTRRVITENKVEAHFTYTTSKFYRSYNDEKIVLEDNTVSEEDKEETNESFIIEYFPMVIVKETAPNSFADIDARLAEIRRSKRPAYKPTSYKGNSSGYYPSYPYNNQSLFPEYNKKEEKNETLVLDTTPVVTKKKEEEVEEVPLCLTESIDDDILESICIQLLTGSVIINKDAVDVKKWVKQMDAVYEKRFGPLDADEHPGILQTELQDNNEKLETWIEAMVEYLVMNTRDEDLLSRLNLLKEAWEPPYDESDISEVCAYCMYEYLEKLPASYVKDMMMIAIYSYIPNGAKDTQ